MKTIGDRIREARLKKGLTLDDLGDLLGLSHATLSKYENNKIENIPSDRIQDIAKILEVTPSFLMGWNEPSNKKQIEIVNKLYELTKNNKIKWEKNGDTEYINFITTTPINSDFEVKYKNLAYTADVNLIFYHIIKTVDNDIHLFSSIPESKFSGFFGFYSGNKSIFIASSDNLPELLDLYNFVTGFPIDNIFDKLINNLDKLDS